MWKEKGGGLRKHRLSVWEPAFYNPRSRIAMVTKKPAEDQQCRTIGVESGNLEMTFWKSRKSAFCYPHLISDQRSRKSPQEINGAEWLRWKAKCGKTCWEMSWFRNPHTTSHLISTVKKQPETKINSSIWVRKDDCKKQLLRKANNVERHFEICG